MKSYKKRTRTSSPLGRKTKTKKRANSLRSPRSRPLPSYGGSVAQLSPARKKRTRARGAFTDEQLRSAGVVDEEKAENLMSRFLEVDDGAGERSLVEEGATASSPPSVPMAEYEGLPISLALKELIDYASNPKFRESWRIACWVHVSYKLELYQGAYLATTREANALRERLERKGDDFGLPSEERWKVLSDDDALGGLLDTAHHFLSLVEHCREKARNLETGVSLPTLNGGKPPRPLASMVDSFRATLVDFARKSLQHEITDFVARALLAFFQNPFYPRNKFFSMIFVGAPGTGKTTVARGVAEVLSASGLFEGGFHDKGKPDFIGQYLGQTPHLTKRTLVTYALEGVLLVDEAYSLCNLDERGRVDMYGSEFATALVDFMTRYKGLCCVIAAGYEREMRTQFLAANEGLPRRFPHRFLLRDLDSKQMAGIVASHNRAVLRPASEQAERAGEGSEGDPKATRTSTRKGGGGGGGGGGLAGGAGTGASVPVFADGALDAVEAFVAGVRRDRASVPHLYRLLENQAGSASNLAEFLSTVVEGRARDRYFKPLSGDVLSMDLVRNAVEKANTRIETEDVRDALRTVAMHSGMSERDEAMRELDRYGVG